MGLPEVLDSAGGGRRFVVTVGAVLVALVVGYPVLPFVEDASTQLRLVLGALVGVPGLVLLYGGYRLPRSDIHPDLYATVGAWCLRGIAVGLAVLIPIVLASDDANVVGNALLLTGLGGLAGFGAGRYDARAKTRQLELRDTVERLEASNERLERHQQYTDDVLDAIEDVFYVLGEDGRLKRWNESLAELSGYPDEEIASMSGADFFQDDRRKAEAAIREGFETGAVSVQLDLHTRDGDTVPVEFVASRLEDAAGDPVLAGIGRDVTNRVERERTLERRARQQEAVADLGQFTLENDDLDELMSEAARRVAAVLDNEYCQVLDLDAENDELVLRQGVGWDDGVVGEATVSAVESDSQAAYTLATDRSVVVVEDLETETRFGGAELLTDHDVRSGISTIVGPFDDPWGILGTHDTEPRTFTDEDVNFVKSVANVLAEAIERHRYQAELERLVADLEESNERLEQFAYAASHDLQEPLRMVSSYLQLIEDRAGDELTEETEEFLEFAVDGADRMRDMIDGLLAYSRVETKGAPLEPVDLDDVVGDVRDDLERRLAESDADVEVAPLPRVMGDERQLRQVFQNLLKNAVQYSGDEPPEIRVSAARSGSMWEVSVSDRGIGIEPDEQERIFDVFQRLHSRRHQQGSGIGLALCERIVERHGGDIWVESEPGAGSTFSFTLPAEDTHGT